MNNPPAAEPRVAVVVDGHSTGRFLVQEFADRGIGCVHVQTGAYGADSLRDNTQYLAQYNTESGVAALVSDLAEYPVCAVIPGLEGDGVIVADELSDALGLPGNAVKTSSRRRDKARMANALDAAGVRHIPHAISVSATELISVWREWGCGRVVVKPPASAGSEDVLACSTEEGIEAAVNEIVGKINACEHPNVAAMIQPYISGTEYVINAVSSDGSHCITDMWFCEKEPGPIGTPIDVYSDLLPSTGPTSDVLAEYIRRVLDAVDITWGASHAEVIVTSEGPVLVEVGARLMGGSFDFNKLRTIGAYSQLETTVDAFVDPDSFALKASHPYRQTKSVRTADLKPTQEGMLRSINLEPVRALESYLMEYVAVNPGDQLHSPIDRNTHIGFVTLAHSDLTVVEADYRRLRSVESAIFDVEPE